ncbi:MAG: hypothetical protein RSC61_08115, partial [Glutamicibacter sp.]
SLLIFLGIAIPVALTFGPLFEFLSRPELLGKASMGSISIIVWVPILISAIALIEGRKRIFAPDSKFKVILNGRCFAVRGAERIEHHGSAGRRPAAL